MSLPLVEFSIASFVIFQTLTILVLSVLLARDRWLVHRMHRSVRKWYQQQSALLAHEADAVRDSSCQELLALRRSLELAAINHSSRHPEQYQTWIHQLESLQTSLNGLVDCLVPPFVEESLPLAIAAHLRQLKSRKQGFEFTIEHLVHWELNDPLYINKAVLAFFQALDSDIDAEHGIAAIELAFNGAKSPKSVQIRLQCRGSDSSMMYQRIQDLCQMVVFLSPIEYCLGIEGKTLALEFRWSTVQKV